MILIADGGSTKVDWCLIDKGEIVERVYTSGANPFFRNTEDISLELSMKLVPKLKTYPIDAIYFYGAGCASPEKNNIIETALAENFQAGKIIVGSDLLGAAIGLCGNNKGIACILGTGSNSCYYDGKQIANNVSPLGFILGDEGSGAVLGRLFVGACLKNQFSKSIKDKLLKYLNMDVAQILDRVYKQPLPNRFLAGIAPFIKENIDNPAVHALVFNAFVDFFKKNIMQYDYQKYPVNFIGSVAYHFKDVLEETAASLNIKIGKIEQSPMPSMIEYFSIL